MAYATGRLMCHTALRLPFEVDDVVAMVRKLFAGRVAFHDGEEEIVPGVTVHHVGGHSKGLQSVRVKTARGYVMLAADAAHCGTCSNACAIANGAAACLSGRCAVAGCSSGWADCDGLPGTGCEVSLATASDCGLCGNRCSAVHGGCW